MSTLHTIELKVFVPAKDFELSTQFYQDGPAGAWTSQQKFAWFF